MNSFKYQYIDAETVMLYKVIQKFNIGDIAPYEIVGNELTRLALYSKKQEYLLEIKEKTIQKAKNDKIIEKYNN